MSAKRVSERFPGLEQATTGKPKNFGIHHGGVIEWFETPEEAHDRLDCLNGRTPPSDARAAARAELDRAAEMEWADTRSDLDAKAAKLRAEIERLRGELDKVRSVARGALAAADDASARLGSVRKALQPWMLRGTEPWGAPDVARRVAGLPAEHTEAQMVADILVTLAAGGAR